MKARHINQGLLDAQRPDEICNRDHIPYSGRLRSAGLSKSVKCFTVGAVERFPLCQQWNVHDDFRIPAALEVSLSMAVLVVGAAASAQDRETIADRGEGGLRLHVPGNYLLSR